jgi:multidrug resistance efflux pump
VALAAAALLVAGCGGGDDPPRRGVKLTIGSPGDQALVRGDSVQVAGRVSPAVAKVRVRGEEVGVRDGRFATRVPLDPGTNVVDVLASARDARPAMLALRVQRQVTVSVPRLLGFSPADAQDALASAGLVADVQKDGGILEVLLPVDARVCETDPKAGTTVDPGTTVTVVVSKTC